ncbi:MAG: aa3-type cytochrome oxidase subunit II [Nocardioides sp.]
MAVLHRAKAGAFRRLALSVAVASCLVTLGACSAEQQKQWGNFALPDPATRESQGIFDLWIWGWVAALVTGILVWGLIFWVVFRYRQKSPDEIPVQTRYNLPLEIFYTIAPILMVIVFFYWTVNVQNDVLAEPEPDHTVVVVGSKWSWTFNYTGESAVNDANVYTSGTGSDIPTLWLPVDQTVRFELRSPDVIHSFWIPGFLMKLDVVPGRENRFQVTPRTIGEFKGKCAELCGVYHSRMLFNVKVVSQTDYERHLRDLKSQGNVSDAPVVGGKYADLEVGSDLPEEQTGGEQ